MLGTNRHWYNQNPAGGRRKFSGDELEGYKREKKTFWCRGRTYDFSISP